MGGKKPKEGYKGPLDLGEVPAKRSQREKMRGASLVGATLAVYMKNQERD